MKNDQPDDLDARVQSLVEKRLREAELAKQPPQPEPSRPSTKRWPKLGPRLNAALEHATDQYESRNGRDLGAAVKTIYSQARRDPALHAEIEAWFTDKDAPGSAWSRSDHFEAGLIANLVENRYKVRQAERGHIVSAVPDPALQTALGKVAGS